VLSPLPLKVSVPFTIIDNRDQGRFRDDSLRCGQATVFFIAEPPPLGDPRTFLVVPQVIPKHVFRGYVNLFLPSSAQHCAFQLYNTTQRKNMSKRNVRLILKNCATKYMIAASFALILGGITMNIRRAKYGNYQTIILLPWSVRSPTALLSKSARSF
jgi:hypothetical protein